MCIYIYIYMSRGWSIVFVVAATMLLVDAHVHVDVINPKP